MRLHLLFALILSGSLLLHVVDGASTMVDVGMDGEATSEPTPKNNKPIPLPRAVKSEIRKLKADAFAVGRSSPVFRKNWEQILQLNPRNQDAALQLGLLGLESKSHKDQAEGFILVERAFNPDLVDVPIKMSSPPGMYLAMVVGRYRWEQKEFDKAFAFFHMANNAAKELQTENICIAMSLATMLHPFPKSVKFADEMMALYFTEAEKFLKEYKHPKMDELALSQTVAGSAADPCVHCALSIFHLSFYHRADVARAARLWYRVVTRVWPQLVYTSPNYIGPSSSSESKKCTTEKIRLGIASAFLSPHTSVADDFGGMLQRLDRNEFEITYLSFRQKYNDPTAEFVYENPEDAVLLYDKANDDIMNGAWVTRYHKEVEMLDLDILLYLDHTMSPTVHRMAMARLAKVQATTHGHPLTTGLPSVDYYISWGAAEIETAQDHYVEKLVLLNDTVPHQYYEKRHDEELGISAVDEENYKSYQDRAKFSELIPEDGNWYTCMQKPHKFMPEMDELICGIQKSDPDARVILHLPNSEELLNTFKMRLLVAGCNKDRIHFVPALAHHQLLGLYSVSTVILDSYPAGGCTTTREALEMGRAVLTWPSRLLGGRWTYAYYQILGKEELNDYLIASSAGDYIMKATALGRDGQLRGRVELMIEQNLHKLYKQDVAVRSWEDVLRQISPVERKAEC